MKIFCYAISSKVLNVSINYLAIKRCVFLNCNMTFTSTFCIVCILNLLSDFTKQVAGGHLHWISTVASTVFWPVESMMNTVLSLLSLYSSPASELAAQHIVILSEHRKDFRSYWIDSIGYITFAVALSPDSI